MRILILANRSGGLYRFRKELIETFVSNAHEVFISVPDGVEVKAFVDMGCKVISTNIDRRGTNIVEDIKLIKKYKRIMKEIIPDVVLSYTIKPNIYGGMVASMLGIPYIVNITGLGTAVEKRSSLQMFIIQLYKYAFRNVRCVFFQNSANKAFFEKNKIAMGKHRLIPGSGVNLEKFTPLDYPADDTIEFVFISRIMKEKGIDHYLEAAEYIRKKYAYTQFHICGFCEEAYEDILEQKQNENIIIYHGMVSDIREILKHVHCTVHPTYYPEGLSNVLLESSACGRAIITTDRSGCREVIDDGVNGYMILQNDTQSLVYAIEKFIKLSNEERKQMGINARKRVEKEFDRQIVIDAYMEEINKITGAVK